MVLPLIIAGPPACGFLEDGYIVYDPSRKRPYLSRLNNETSGTAGTWTDATFDVWITKNLSLAKEVCDMVGNAYVMEVVDLPDEDIPW